jgi:hypothetical protein
LRCPLGAARRSKLACHLAAFPGIISTFHAAEKHSLDFHFMRAIEENNSNVLLVSVISFYP